MSNKVTEVERRELWKAVVVAVSGSENVARSSVACAWADECLKSFDKRFQE